MAERGAGTKVPLFEGISPAARRELEARAVPRRFRAGEVLFTAGSPARGLFIITEGQVRVLRGGGGRPSVVHIEGPGGTLGEVPLFDGGGYPATAVAQEDTRCLVITPAVLKAAMALDPGVGWAIARALSARVRDLVQRLDRYAAQNVTERLASWLRERAIDGVVTLGQTQQQLAEELGTVREVLVRSLRELKTTGVIQSAGRGKFKFRR